MNDRYLFKAKRLDNGEWVQGALFNGENHCIIGQEIKFSPYTEHECKIVGYEVDRNTICQCTGLKDKNGKLIWENDIVDYLGRKGKVKYECGSFGIVFREIIDWEEIEANICLITGCDNSLYACENDNFISLWEIMWNFNDIENSIETIEVIGNIFDNPELLESEVEE